VATHGDQVFPVTFTCPHVLPPAPFWWDSWDWDWVIEPLAECLWPHMEIGIPRYVYLPPRVATGSLLVGLSVFSLLVLLKGFQGVLGVPGPQNGHGSLGPWLCLFLPSGMLPSLWDGGDL